MFVELTGNRLHTYFRYKIVYQWVGISSALQLMTFQAFKVYLSQVTVATNMFFEKIIQTLTMKDAFQIVNIALHLNKTLKLKEHFI